MYKNNRANLKEISVLHLLGKEANVENIMSPPLPFKWDSEKSKSRSGETAFIGKERNLYFLLLLDNTASTRTGFA